MLLGGSFAEAAVGLFFGVIVSLPPWCPQPREVENQWGPVPRVAGPSLEREEPILSAFLLEACTRVCNGKGLAHEEERKGRTRWRKAYNVWILSVSQVG